MKNLMIVKYSGDTQGTMLEKMLKHYVHKNFNNTICSEDAIEAIVEDIRKKCDRLAEENPRCKKPEIAKYMQVFNKTYYLTIANVNPIDNNGLLQIIPANKFYISKHETLYSAIDNNLTEI